MLDSANAGLGDGEGAVLAVSSDDIELRRSLTLEISDMETTERSRMRQLTQCQEIWRNR